MRQNHRILCVGVLSATFPALSCVPGPDGLTECPVDAVERRLVQEVVAKILDDALFVTEMTNDVEQGSALTLIGVDQAYKTTAFLVAECTQPEEFEPFCESGGLPPEETEEDFWQTHDRCGQLGCEAANIRLSTVYMTTRPIMAPGDRHSFSYETADPPGIGTYDPNPLITWRVDRSQPEAEFSSTFKFDLTITPTGEDPIDLTYEGDYSATQGADGIAELGLIVRFSELLGDQILEVSLSLVSHEEISGTVKADGETLATVSLIPGQQLLVEWDQSCVPQLDR